MIDTQSFYDKLVSEGFDFFAGVPDSLLKNFCACVTEKTPKANNIITANEGNALAMCAGYYLSTGKYGVTYMQNSGEGNIVNPLLSLVDEEVYSIPVLLIIGWRGEPGVHDEPQHVKQGKITLDLLDIMGVPYTILDDDVDSAIAAAKNTLSSSKPHAFIVRKGIFSEFKLSKIKSDMPMKREDALKIILSKLSEKDFVVSTTGKTSREIFEIREARGQGHGNDFLTVGSMGHTASIAYGMALGTKSNVYCIDGDGSFIMHMGGMAVIGTNPLPNFKYILNDNNAHESVGGQPTCSGGLDIPQILKGFGFETILTASTESELSDMMDVLGKSENTALIVRTAQGSRDDLGRPTTTPVENKEAIMSKLKAERK